MQEADERTKREQIFSNPLLYPYIAHPLISQEGRLCPSSLAFADRLSEPEGLRYAEEFVSPTAEKTLIGHIAALPLQPFQFGQ